jgi:hypothetical protein
MSCDMFYSPLFSPKQPMILNTSYSFQSNENIHMLNNEIE